MNENPQSAVKAKGSKKKRFVVGGILAFLVVAAATATAVVLLTADDDEPCGQAIIADVNSTGKENTTVRIFHQKSYALPLP